MRSLGVFFEETSIVDKLFLSTNVPSIESNLKIVGAWFIIYLITRASSLSCLLLYIFHMFNWISSHSFPWLVQPPQNVTSLGRCQAWVGKRLLNDRCHSWCTCDVFVVERITSLQVLRQMFAYLVGGILWGLHFSMEGCAYFIRSVSAIILCWMVLVKEENLVLFCHSTNPQNTLFHI